jgi:early secretory antigenic target protein ESAT-6
MSEIKVTFGSLEAAGGNITSAAGKVSSSLDDLKRYLQPLVSTWQGQAHETYQTLQAKWDSAAADLQQVLHSIGVAVHSANEAYRAGEQSNTARFSQ